MLGACKGGQWRTALRSLSIKVTCARRLFLRISLQMIQSQSKLRCIVENKNGTALVVPRLTQHPTGQAFTYASVPSTLVAAAAPVARHGKPASRRRISKCAQPSAVGLQIAEERTCGAHARGTGPAGHQARALGAAPSPRHGIGSA